MTERLIARNSWSLSEEANANTPMLLLQVLKNSDKVGPWYRVSQHLTSSVKTRGVVNQDERAPQRSEAFVVVA